MNINDINYHSYHNITADRRPANKAGYPASGPVSSAVRIASNGPGHLRSQLGEILPLLSAHGYLVLQAWDTTEETLTSVAQLFGRIQHHPKANAAGVVQVTEERAKPAAGFERNVSKTNDEFPLHTDGSFLNSLCHDGKRIWRVGPPAMFLLQCVQAARQGGVNILVDGQKVLNDLRRDAPKHAETVMRPGTVSFFGGDQAAIDVPLFEEIRPHRWRLRFRRDLAYAKPWAAASMQYVVEHYLANPAYQISHKLAPGEILIVDNQRMLHGRDSIAVKAREDELPRHLRRVWIWDESQPEVVAVDPASLSPRKVAALQVHHPLAGPAAGVPLLAARLGIRLPGRRAWLRLPQAMQLPRLARKG